MPSTPSYSTSKFTQASDITELPAQQMLATMSNKPARAALNGLFSSFPVVKVFTSNSVPIMVYREQEANKSS